MIIHSCDSAIVYNCDDGRQQYIRFNKENNYFSLEFQGKSFVGLQKKIDWLKKEKLWNELLDDYLFKKNTNNNPDKHSRSIFAESINEMCQKQLSKTVRIDLENAGKHLFPSGTKIPTNKQKAIRL